MHSCNCPDCPHNKGCSHCHCLFIGGYGQGSTNGGITWSQPTQYSCCKCGDRKTMPIAYGQFQVNCNS